MNLKISTIVVVASIIVVSCKPTNINTQRSDKTGTLILADNVVISSLFPHNATSQTEIVTLSQIHESLLRLNPKTLEVIPALAEKWESSPDGKTITFHLVKGARFHNDDCYDGGDGPEITSKDVKFSIELLCTKEPGSVVFDILLKDRLAGGNDFHDKKATSLNCIKVIDDYTFSIELASPSLSFLKILAHPSVAIINEIAYKKYGKELKNGAGPFMFDASSTAEKTVLVRNPTYYAKDEKGNGLPYLDTVVMNSLPSIEDALTLYENKQLDLVNTLPSIRVREIVEENIKEFSAKPPKSLLKHEAEMSTQYYTFNTKQAPFDNVKVRQAISQAIDKEKIVADVLQGQAISAGNYGITPNVFNGYDVHNVHGWEFDVPQAKKLLAEAGYPNGKGFPEIKLIITTGSSRNSNVLFEIQKQLKENLNISLTFDALLYEKKMDLQKNGKASMFRDGWTADYPSPETFLTLFYGNGVPADANETSYPNTSRYQSTTFDNYFIKGRTANNQDTSYTYFMEAERQLINDAVIIPLWYEGTYRLLNNQVKNLELNAMRYYDLRKVYKEK